MAITSHADLAGMMDAAATIAATITGIQKVYDKVGEIPADDTALPAIVQTAISPDLPPNTVDYMANLQAITFHWYLDVLVGRAGDIYAEQAAALPFIPLVTTKFRQHMNLGAPLYVADCRIDNQRFVTISHGDQAFFAVRFLMRCKGKAAVSYSDAA